MYFTIPVSTSFMSTKGLCRCHLTNRKRLNLFCPLIFQDEKNQVMKTNVWLQIVSCQTELSIFDYLL